MADKQQNVKVVWNVDTSQLEKSTQLANQAQVAADKFTQAAQKSGSAVADGYKGANQSLLQMRQQLERLKYRIENTAQGDKKRLSELSAQYKSLDLQIKNATKSLYDQEKAIKASSTAAKTQASTFANLQTAIASVFSAVIIKQVITTALEMAKLAGNVEGVKKAFDKLPGSFLLLNDLRQATQGTVTDFELMQRSLQAKNFRIPLEQLASLFQFATVRAQQTGQSVDYLINSIVFGLGFQSIRRLDNVGISAAELRDVMKELGVSLNEAFNIVVQREIEKMGGLVKTSATEVEILTTRVEELRTALSKKLTSGGAIEFVSQAIAYLKVGVETFPLDKWYKILNPLSSISLFGDWVDGIDEAIIHIQNAETAARDLRTIMDGLPKAQREQSIALIEELIHRKEQIRFGEQLLRQKEAEQKLNKLRNGDTLQNLEITKRINHEIEAIGNSLEVNRIIASELGKVLFNLTKGIANELGLIEAKEKEIESVGDALNAAKSTQEIHELNNELARLEGQLADLKAFGTTKQFLEVNGRVKLVPVEDYKIKQYKVQTTNAIGELQVKTKLVLGTNQDPNVGIKQLEDDIQKMIDQMRFTIPPPAALSQGITPMSDFERIGQEFSDNWKDILSTGIDDTTNFFDAVIQAEADQYDARVQQAARFYDEQILLAGDNERRQLELKIKSKREEDRLRRDAFEKEKEARRASTVINGAAGIVRAFATLDFYQAIAASAVIAAETIAQLAAINQQTARFKDGVIDLKGPGSKTSDSIPARLSRGESVMTADETSGARGILEDIRAGRLNDRVLAKTIDDKVLERLKLSGTGVSMVGMDDSRIVKEIHELKGSLEGFEEKHGQLWKYTKKSETMKQYVRAKSF
jgi:hypothetical protein